jgi:hypothetical protein
MSTAQAPLSASALTKDFPAVAISLSRRHLSRAGGHLRNLQGRLERASKKTERALDRVLDTAICVGAAGGLGLLHGRHGPVEVVGVPIELALGAGAFGASAFGVGGKHADKLGSLGNGLLSVYTYTMAKGAGLNLKAKHDQGPKVTGALPTERLTPAERIVMQAPVEAQRA